MAGSLICRCGDLMRYVAGNSVAGSLICRCGDLMRSGAERLRSLARVPWDPARDSHRGRVTFSSVSGGAGCGASVRMTLRMKPHKTDLAGKCNDDKTFLCDPDASSLSAGTAVLVMLAGDPVAGDPRHVARCTCLPPALPFFRCHLISAPHVRLLWDRAGAHVHGCGERSQSLARRLGLP